MVALCVILDLDVSYAILEDDDTLRLETSETLPPMTPSVDGGEGNSLLTEAKEIPLRHSISPIDNFRD